MSPRVAGSRSPGSRATGGPSSRAGSSAIPRSTTSPGSTAGRPPADLERTEFIEADIRSPVLSRLLPGDRGRHGRPLRDPLVPRARASPARALHEINVIGTLQLLAACERHRDAASGWSSAARRRSTAARARSPSFFTEELARALPLRTRFQRDISELENYFENFARRHPRRSPAACCATSPRSAPASTARWSAT